MKKPPQRRVGLQLKIVAGLLVISMVPLLVSAMVIEWIADVSDDYTTTYAVGVRKPFENTLPVYSELIKTKNAYYAQTTRRFAATPEITRFVSTRDRNGVDAILEDILLEAPELYRITIFDNAGEVLAERGHRAPDGIGSRYQSHPVTAPVGDTGARLRLTFAADHEIQQEMQRLRVHLDNYERLDQMRGASLPRGYRRAFLAVVGGVVMLVTGAGIFMARRLTKRIELLVTGTRAVAAGDLGARVDLTGRDELAELAQAFNRMLEDIERDRQQISYLQRVGAWQDVARRLAHEIKNPLTPIQLAVQQCVSSYDGNDERFENTLHAAEEIVGEEIASLRRLVDAFRTLGQLPKVEPEPLDLGTVIEDLEKDPSLNEHLRLDPPGEPVRVRGDRLLLRRVLTNLVDNAVQAGNDAGSDLKVVVGWRARSADNQAIVTVDDHGPGIPAEKRKKIFEPYVTSKELGTGLGLAISKKIALEHGGSLDVSAQPAPTGGARFELSLPLAAPDDEQASASA